MDPPASPRALEGAATLPFVGMYRSIYQYKRRCALLGCHLPSPIDYEVGYCCRMHRNFAEANALMETSFHYLGGFLNIKDKQKVCTESICNRLRGFQVGIPILHDLSVLHRLPWDQPEIFRTDVGISNWLFFVPNLPETFKQITGADGLKWHANNRYSLQIPGITDDENVFYTTPFNLRTQQKEPQPDQNLVALAKTWVLHLYESGNYYLFCLSRTSDEVLVDPKPIVTPSRKTDDGPPPTDSEASTSKRKTATTSSVYIAKVSQVAQRRKSQKTGQKTKTVGLVVSEFLTNTLANRLARLSFIPPDGYLLHRVSDENPLAPIIRSLGLTLYRTSGDDSILYGHDLESYGLFDLHGNQIPPKLVTEVGEAFKRILEEVKPLMWVEAQRERHSGIRVEMLVKARSQFKERSTETDVEIELSVPTDVSTEVGSLISMGSMDSSECFHDPSMKSSNAGKVWKSLPIKPHADGSGYFISLSITAEEENLISLRSNIAFSGSFGTGSKAMTAAAKLVKPVSMELGGKSPLIVFDNVDLDKAAECALFGCFWKNGQICTATSRLLVHGNIAAEFIEKLVKWSKNIKISDPMEEGCRLGPVVSKEQYEKILEFISTAKSEGATILHGGLRLEVGGSWVLVSPTPRLGQLLRNLKL